eukprot:TRINITY_DN7819_c0_g1_i1.p1 TRINITY_DN7819_c0_g1~~TRINITY_DN7819_c0_g1_i1.p1  ORF type:complete len:287 (-),score=0.26 TRINITY_DN7819_c0_g1_i1:233-1093(-)
MCIRDRPYIEMIIAIWWDYLRDSWWFASVYFETFLTVSVWITFLVVYIILSHSGRMKRYQMQPNAKWSRVAAIPAWLRQLFFYLLPLLILDTFTVKIYRPHVTLEDPRFNPERIFRFIANWTSEVQIKRVLPAEAPSMDQIALHILLTSVIYDIFFAMLHFTLHRIQFLFVKIHKYHHRHTTVTADVTTQLHIVEHILIVLLANLSLNIVGAHPLTRMIYVPILLFLLGDNHSGYDIPWNYDKIIPFKIMGGSRAHLDHHLLNNTHFQPFFTFLQPLFHKISAGMG